jgi:hypothetical protein
LDKRGREKANKKFKRLAENDRSDRAKLDHNQSFHKRPVSFANTEHIVNMRVDYGQCFPPGTTDPPPPPRREARTKLSPDCVLCSTQASWKWRRMRSVGFCKVYFKLSKEQICRIAYLITLTCVCVHVCVCMCVCVCTCFSDAESMLTSSRQCATQQYAVNMRC